MKGNQSYCRTVWIIENFLRIDWKWLNKNGSKFKILFEVWWSIFMFIASRFLVAGFLIARVFNKTEMQVANWSQFSQYIIYVLRRAGWRPRNSKFKKSVKIILASLVSSRLHFGHSKLDFRRPWNFFKIYKFKLNCRNNNGMFNCLRLDIIQYYFWDQDMPRRYVGFSSKKNELN